MKSSPKSADRAPHLPRVGVPWRTTKQERARDMRYNRDYLRAIRKAGGQPVQLSLLSPPAKLAQIARTLDAVLLPGSPADINPKFFGARPHAKASPTDVKREKTDFALLKHALGAGKPVLAICYGIQSLNVHLGGSLVQDIPSELPRHLTHSGKPGRQDPDPTHEVTVTGGGLAALAGRPKITVNSLHHQSVGRPGQGLRVAAKSSDGVIEAVEWTHGPGWALGVQWHPERMPKDPLSQKIFRRLISEAVMARDRLDAGSAKRVRPRSKAGRATRVAERTPNKGRRSRRQK